MSDVEKFYYSISKHFPGALPWNKLDHISQAQFVQAINMILQVLSKN
jgi:hypothetical protein